MLADGVASCVDRRAQDVDRDYQAHARKLDAEHFSHIQDVAARPVLTRLRSYGCVIGLSVGAFSETSATIRALLSMVVAAAADCHWQEVGATSPRAARSVFMCVTRRRWGCQFAMLLMPGSVVTTRAWPALGPLPTPPTQTISTSTLALLLTTLPVPPPSSVGVLLASAGESDAA